MFSYSDTASSSSVGFVSIVYIVSHTLFDSL